MKKIFKLEEVQKIILKKKKIVLCHGVYDLLHIGHIYHLQEAKSYGDFLIVSITPDKFISKGPGRPYFNLMQRAKSIAALECVDMVILNNSSTAISVINQIKPNIYCKGPDYKNKYSDFTGNIEKEIKAIKKNKGKFLVTQNIQFSSSKILNEKFDIQNESQKKIINNLKKKFSFLDIKNIINNLKKNSCLIVGEAIIDAYNFCEAVGKSGKEPILIFKDLYTRTFLGGSLAIANNMSAFQKKIYLCHDASRQNEYNKFIKSNLKKNVSQIYSYFPNKKIIVKKRFIDNLTNTKIHGLYSIEDNVFSKSKLKKNINQIIKKTELSLISDYGHGHLTDDVINLIIKKSNFLSVNAQINSSNVGFHNLEKFKNINLLIINENELRFDFRDNISKIENLMKRKSIKQNIKHIVVTRGIQGSIMYVKFINKFIYAPAFTSKVVDKVGAGDTMMSILAPLIASRCDYELSMFISSIAGSISVRNYANSVILDDKILLKEISHIYM
jgi:rfaE bifunctional protein nucleotidyltransferase chain/domain